MKEEPTVTCPECGHVMKVKTRVTVNNVLQSGTVARVNAIGGPPTIPPRGVR